MIHNAMRILARLLILIFILSLIIIAIDGLYDDIQPSDVAIIFGSKVNSDGTLSNRLTARLDKGVTLYRAHQVKYLLVSGGIGKEGVDEAVAMQQYLLAQHLPADRILTDSHGNNTAATAKNSALIMEKKGLYSALVISQYFHISRARLALQQCGISPIHTAHANYMEWRDGYSLAREVFGFYDYRFLRHACG